MDEREDVYQDIFQEMADELLKPINKEDIRTIYEIFKRSDPHLFKSAVEDCCGTDNLDNAPERFGEIFYRYIVCNCITSKLVTWVKEVFGNGVAEYLFTVGERESCSDPRNRKNDMEVYKNTNVYKLLQTLVLTNWDCSKWEKVANGLLQLRYVIRS